MPRLPVISRVDTYGNGVSQVGFLSQYIGNEAGSYSRLIDSCIAQLKAQGPSRTCDECKEEEEENIRELRIAPIVSNRAETLAVRSN